MKRILGIGTPIIDHILKVDSSFVDQLAGEKGGMQAVDLETFSHIISSSQTTAVLVPGGSACNTIKGLANLGHDCSIIGKIGKDDAAKYFLETMSPPPITPLFQETNTPTAQVISLVEPNGQRTFRCLLNASIELKGADLDPEHFKNIDLVHIEGYSLLCERLTIEAMNLAKKFGALVSFDLSSFEVVQQHKKTIYELLKKHVDVLFGNENEIIALTEMPTKEACAFLRDYCSVVVVLRGINGCTIGSTEGIYSYPTFPVERPVDTTGAGDLFASGFLHGYLKGLSHEESARIGAILGSTVVQVFGAIIPPEKWAHLKQHI